MGQKIFAILFVVIALGAMVYILRSGLVNDGLQSLEQATHNSLTGGNGASSSSAFSLFPIFKISPNPSGSESSNNEGSSVPGNPTSTINPADIPSGFTADQLSPYFQDIRLNGVSYGGQGYYGTITLSAAWQGSTTVDITGWDIKTRDSGEYIPQAINLYDPSGLTQPTDIVLGSGQQVLLYSSEGPFNLRLNECIGYIANQNKFTPALPITCPPLDYSQITNLTGACQNYIQSIGSCEVPDLNTAPISHSDYACIDYVSNINYKSCFDAHVSDPNFLSNQWWVWTGANVVDQYHDQVELLDKNGLLVDVYTY